MAPHHFLSRFFPQTGKLSICLSPLTYIDEYSMMSHCQGNPKLEYNGGFKAQLQVITFITSVKETLVYNSSKLLYEWLYQYVSCGLIFVDFLPLRLNYSSLTCSICALASIILQLIAMECQKLYMVDSPMSNRFLSIASKTYKFFFNGSPFVEKKMFSVLKRVDSFAWKAMKGRFSRLRFLQRQRTRFSERSGRQNAPKNEDW